MELPVGTCASCGRGRIFTAATFEAEKTRVRWTMWTCGHTSRTALADDGTALVSPSERAVVGSV
jgi:uncharacterized protein (DUF983 family)